MSQLNEDDFYTTLSTGEEVPVRFVGDSYIVTYGLMDKKEFAEWATKLHADFGETVVYDDDEDVYFGNVVLIDFDEDSPKIRFGYGPNAIEVTYVEVW